VDSAAAPPAPPRFVTIDRWRRAARSLLAGAVPRWTSLRTAARANFTVLPFQLEPAIAVASGDACRVLIADEVGLGKTIQAGLIIAETLARTPDARVLIVAPAGLREQWRDELQSRSNRLRDPRSARPLCPLQKFSRTLLASGALTRNCTLPALSTRGYSAPQTFVSEA